MAGALADILAALPPESRAFLVSRLEPSARRAYQLQERNAALRDAAALLFPGLGATVQAKQLDRALVRYLAGTGRERRHLAELPPGASAEERALHRVARCCDGPPPGARQLFNVLAEVRPPMKSKGLPIASDPA